MAFQREDVSVTFQLKALDTDGQTVERRKSVDFQFRGASDGDRITNLLTDIDAWVTAFEAVSEAKVNKYWISLQYGLDAVPSLNTADMWKVALLSVYLDGYADKVGVIEIQAPKNAIMSDGKVLIAETVVTDLIDEYTAGTGYVQLSDDEQVRGTDRIAGSGYRRDKQSKR